MTRYQLDSAHSTIEFSVRHLVIARMRGRFTNFAGVLDLDPDDLARSQVVVEIETASISTTEPGWDAQLRSADFFDVENHPLIQFASQRVEQDGHYLRIVGALTLHGVTREVVVRAEPLGSLEDPFGQGRVAFSATTSIRRKDFGLDWNQAIGAMVGDKVELHLDILAVRAEARAAA